MLQQPVDGPTTPQSGCSLSASLDPLETSSHPLRLQSRAQDHLHRKHAKERRRLIVALHGSDDDHLVKRSHRLGGCCCTPTLRVGSDGRPSAELSRCRDRLCPLCSRLRQRDVEARLTAATAKTSGIRFITLTRAPQSKPLAEIIDDLTACFAKLRRLALWKKHVHSAAAVMEFKISLSDRHWHVHLHLLVGGKFIPQALLKDAWYEITGDSFIVDVRAVHERGDAIAYVAKYAGKPPDTGSWSEDEIREYASATHGRRLVNLSGGWHNNTIDEDDTPDSPKESKHVVSVHVLERAAREGYKPAQRAIDILHRCGGAVAAVLAHCRSDTPADAPEPTSEEISEALKICDHVEASFPRVPVEEAPPDEQRSPTTGRTPRLFNGTLQ